MGLDPDINLIVEKDGLDKSSLLKAVMDDISEINLVLILKREVLVFILEYPWIEFD